MEVLVAIHKEIDLFNMKAIANYMQHSKEFKEFGKKIDEKLIDYISEKYEVDQKEFKENRVNYDDNGRIAQIQDENGKWVKIEEIYSFKALDQKIFNPNENEVEKRNEMKENEDKLSLYLVADNKHMIGDFAFNEDEAYDIAKKMSSDDIHISEEMTDLIAMKSIIKWNSDANYGELPENVRAFEEKVDKKLVEHICDKYYSGYEGCKKDQEKFKTEKVEYDENGLLVGMQNDKGGYVEMNGVYRLSGLDELYTNKDWGIKELKSKSKSKSKPKKDTGRDI